MIETIRARFFYIPLLQITTIHLHMIKQILKNHSAAIPSNTSTAAIAEYFTPAYKIPQTNANNFNMITNAHTAKPNNNAPAAAPSGVILSSDIPGKFVVRKRNTSSFPSSVNRFIAFSSISHPGESSSSLVVFRQNRHLAATETSLLALLLRDEEGSNRKVMFEDEDIRALHEKHSLRCVLISPTKL